jgi:hypothetical protein
MHCQVDLCLNVDRCTIEATHAVEIKEPRDVDPDEGSRYVRAVLCTEHARQVAPWAERVETLPREVAA